MDLEISVVEKLPSVEGELHYLVPMAAPQDAPLRESIELRTLVFHLA
jgi:hypothetical protein